MTRFEWLSLGLGVFTAVLIPVITLSIRSAVKWARLESKVEGITQDIKTIMEQMIRDREATDKRLTGMQEFLWRLLGKSGPTNAV